MNGWAPLLVNGEEGRAYSVAPHSGGNLSCSGVNCRAAVWCEHIQEVITSGHDAPSVWAHGFSVDPWTPFVDVPVMPTQEIWAKVRLDQASDSVLKVNLHAPPQRNPPDGYSPFIGFISEGEGRAVIRQMLIGWFEPWYNQHSRDVPCGSIHHTPGRTMQVIRQGDANPVNKFINAWTLFFFQQCMICWKNQRRQIHQAPGAGQVFPPDLIPRI